MHMVDKTVAINLCSNNVAICSKPTTHTHRGGAGGSVDQRKIPTSPPPTPTGGVVVDHRPSPAGGRGDLAGPTHIYIYIYI